MTDTDAPALVTLDDAARTLSCSRRYLEKLIARQVLSPVRLGRAVRLRREDVRRLAAVGVR